MHQMTAAQKLGRLKLIDALLKAPRVDFPLTIASLEVERASLLAEVGLPPLEVLGNPWGEAWALAFAMTFPGFDTDTLEVWFKNACAAGARAGYADGKAAGVNARLVETLEVIRNNCGTKIRSNALFTREGGNPLHLVTFIDEALAAAAHTFELPAEVGPPPQHRKPDGWEVNTADFSLLASGRSKTGTVTLIRDEAGRAAWHALDEAGREAVALYISGEGASISEALVDAYGKAHAAGALCA